MGANRPLGKPVTGMRPTLYLCSTKRRKCFHPLTYLVYYVHPATVVFGSKLHLQSRSVRETATYISHAVYRSWILKA